MDRHIRCIGWHARTLARGACAGLLAISLAQAIWSWPAKGAEPAAVSQFHQEVEPLLKEYCYDCHGDGAKKGQVALDECTTPEAILNPELWFKVLKNTRAGLMPPYKKPRPSGAEQQRLERWIKYSVFRIDPDNPEPGKVTVRRLNRIEYRNTIHDLMGVNFNTTVEFPPDDTGYGFDTIGDVLTVPPMLLEKYLAAARSIVGEALGSTSFSARLFTSKVPQAPAQRRAYARELLGGFATRAFRRPVDEQTLDRLVALAEGVYQQPGETFAAGIGQGLVAVLSSPRFLFRLEEPEGSARAGTTVRLDEYSLASRLSYFLWSTMPDDELLQLARDGQLRSHLEAQVRRMLADSRSENFIRNFTGQWLKTRDVEAFPINEEVVLARDKGEGRQLRNAQFSRFRSSEPHVELDYDLREAMRRETRLFFAGIVKEDRPVTELIESDYTFVNEKLARFYGLTNVTGPQMRRVTLPAGSPRGGVLTDASVLLVTSNPDRTSSVKRGRFILENFLGLPPPPPPPNVPSLETAEKTITDHAPTLRETLQMHRSQPLCASCHARMDPLGLAFENFNALGMWRLKERNQAIDASGNLITGESFANVQELKHILATKHQADFYRCLTEKLLTYALGRGLEYYDVETVDQIVQQLEERHGRFSALLLGVIESAPFQKTRTQAMATAGTIEESAEPVTARRVARNAGGT
jgi:hypothetical protein